LDSDDAGYEHHAFSHTANGVAAAWSGRLKTLEHWINNGELLRAWQDVASFQRAIQSHESKLSTFLSTLSSQQLLTLTKWIQAIAFKLILDL